MDHLPGVAAVLAATAALVKATADLIATFRTKGDDERWARGVPGARRDHPCHRARHDGLAPGDDRSVEPAAPLLRELEADM